MKLNKRLTVKGEIDYKNNQVICFDKDLGEYIIKFDDIFAEFDGRETTLTLSHDKKVIIE